jgi:hypothetical protein
MESKAEAKEDAKKIPVFFSPVAPSLLHEAQFHLFICKTKARKVHSVSPKKRLARK